MAKEDIKTLEDLLKLIKNDVPKNVIPTGMGNHPNQIGEELGDFYRTAEAAAKSTITRPTQMLDGDLLGVSSERLQRLERAAAKGKQAAKFKVPAKTPVTRTATPTPKARAETIIETPTGTRIRPIGAPA